MNTSDLLLLVGRQPYYIAATVTAVGSASVVDLIAVVLAVDKEMQTCLFNIFMVAGCLLYIQPG